MKVDFLLNFLIKNSINIIEDRLSFSTCLSSFNILTGNVDKRYCCNLEIGMGYLTQLSNT